jgi:hypothetical protein
MDFEKLRHKEQKKLVKKCLKKRVKKARDSPVKFWVLKHFEGKHLEGNTYFGANLRVAFSGCCIEEAVLKMDKSLYMNARDYKRKPISLIRDQTDVVCECYNKEDEDGDTLFDIDWWTDRIITNLRKNDTLWIEEYTPYPVL